MGDDIPHHLLCPICMELPLDKVFQCRDGHVLCSNCYSKVRACPNCRAPYGRNSIRCRYFEGMLEELKVDCPFKAEGCTSKVLRRELESHKENCQFNKFGELVHVCKALVFNDCPFKLNEGNEAEAIEHFRRHHDLIISKNESLRLELVSFEEISSRKNSLQSWKPIILNVEEKCAIILVAVYSKKYETLSIVPYHIRVKGKEEPQLKISIAKEAPLIWTASSINILKVNEIPPSQYPVSLRLTKAVKKIIKRGSLFVDICVISSTSAGAEIDASQTISIYPATSDGKMEDEDLYSWIPRPANDDIPDEAIPWWQNDNFMYITRVKYDSEVIPGTRFRSGMGSSAYIVYLDTIHLGTDFEYLSADPNDLAWVQAGRERIPENGVIGGEDADGDVFYIGRHEDFRGTVDPRKGTLTGMMYGSNDVREFHEFEMLVQNK